MSVPQAGPGHTDGAWLWLDSGPGEPAFNMALDEALLEAVARLGQPVLRFYAWTKPAATFGYFQRHADIARWTTLRPLVRRPTGGGLVPHDADWTYSLVVPPAHPWYTLRAPDSYERVHAWIRDAFALLGVPTELAAAGRTPQPGQCFVGHERSDVLWHGRKLAGAAQRRNQSGLLIQGSVQPPPLAPPLRRPDWEQSMAEAARCAWGVQWQAWPPHPEILTRARGLAREKYSQATHNEKR